MKDGVARADDLPLVLPVLGAKELPRGAHIRVRLGDIDLIALDVAGTLIERLDFDERDADAKPAMEDLEEEEINVGTVAIAMDVSEPPLELTT
jgi:exoribonuclease-2